MPRSKPDETSSDLTEVVADLRSVVSRLEASIAELSESVATRDARIAELEAQLGEARRSGKRQAARSPRERPTTSRLGAQVRQGSWPHGRRMAPIDPDRERDVEQFQAELPDMRPIVTRLRVGIGRYRDCRRRVQGRHPDQGL